ncbi:putative TIM-barrel fold metal-dependent hydrolase [Curtobacterium sp. PhB130]|uniref:amidohydrolase family protein n=1 Tax=Curtobacterium sp. PhB130 TaxID=2485178 RepID=UPI000F4D0D72|nr:amidohydrolase family protein [Curtobacterium sp. PhB130]ROS77886.1 putative TIM-barrel fold metal-dependent hydrolase [Curtobacterium sp. PhB130]
MPATLTDVHAHFLTDDYVAAARAAGIEHPDGMPGWPGFDLDDQVAAMDRRGIERAVLSVSSPGVHLVAGDDAGALALAEHVNDAATGMVRTHPERLAFLAAVPLPDVDAAVRELRRAMDAGALGAIVESNAHGRYLGDPAFEPLWAELDRRRGILFVHPTSPPAWEQTSLGLPRPMLEFMVDSTRTVIDLLVAGVVARHPGMRVVVPHSGATLGVLADRVSAFLPMLVGADVGAAWDAQLQELWFDTAGTPFPRAIPALTGLVGTDRVLYGSDSCWTPPAGVDAQLAAIDGAPAPEGATSWRALTAANAERLLAGPAA